MGRHSWRQADVVSRFHRDPFRPGGDRGERGSHQIVGIATDRFFRGGRREGDDAVRVSGS